MGSSSPSFAIGIDLGSISSCVAVLRHHTENPKIIPSSVGRSTTPSFVGFNFEDGEETVYAGQAAKELALDDPQNSVFDIKHLIGKLFYDQRIQTYKQLWPFHLVNVTGLVGVKLGDRTLLPNVIVKELISHLKTTAELFLECSIDSAVVAIPVYYSEMQKGLTKWACEEAGFTSVQFITEPVSAAIAYGLQTSIKSHEIKTYLTYDLGGRTLEVTVFRLGANRQVDVIASGGDDRLGGEDITDLLTEYCNNEFKRISGIDLFEGKASDNAEVHKTSERMLRRIRNECEINKCFLSDTFSVVVSVDHVHGDKSMNVRVTRENFENLIGSLLTRSIQIVDETLKKCGVEKNEIDDVILIGGSSRIPKVQQMVDAYFEGKRLLSSINMDEAVACGAAIYAHDIFTHKGGAPLSIVTFKKQMIQCWNNIKGFPPRSRHAAAAIGTTIYSFGGNNSTGHPSYLRDGPLDIFALKTDDAKMKWKSLSVENPEFSPNQRWYHSAVAYKEFVIIFGGWDAKKNAYSNSVHRFDTETLTWDAPEVSGNIPETRFMHSSVVVEHEMIVFGGFNYGIQLKNDLHSLNLNTFHWSIIPGKGICPSLSYAHSATLYKKRFIFIFGGYDSKKKKGEYLQDLFCFDLILKEWTVPKTGGTTPQSRRGHSAFTHDGLMFIFGGENAEYSCLNDIFSYNSETAEWTEIKPIGQPPSPLEDFACVALDDKVFTFGGFSEDYLHDTVMEFKRVSC